MSPDQKKCVQETWWAIAPGADAVARFFYRRLFESDPALRELFAGVDPAAQRQKLVTALDLVIAGLDDLQPLLPTLAALGARHARYGVTDGQFDTVGKTLLATLQHALGPAWNEPARLAWSEAYGLIAGVMREALRQEAPSHG